MKTKNLNSLIIKEAISICHSIYRMNAPSSAGYVFNINGKEINMGMYISYKERYNKDYMKWDGYVDFDNNTILDVNSGECKKLTAP